MKDLQLYKAKILQNWQEGDDAAAARIVERLIGQPVTKQALRLWRHGGGSKLDAAYIEAHRRVQAARRRKQSRQMEVAPVAG